MRYLLAVLVTIGCVSKNFDLDADLLAVSDASDPVYKPKTGLWLASYKLFQGDPVYPGTLTDLLELPEDREILCLGCKCSSNMVSPTNFKHFNLDCLYQRTRTTRAYFVEECKFLMSSDIEAKGSCDLRRLESNHIDVIDSATYNVDLLWFFNGIF